MQETNQTLGGTGQHRQGSTTVLFWVVMVAVVLTGCGTQPQDGLVQAEASVVETGSTTVEGQKSPVPLGLVTDLSGRFVTFGRDINVAVSLAVEDVNAAGGVNGSPMQITVEDTAGDPESAVLATRGLAEQGVFAISGPLSSGEAEVVFAQLQQLEVPLLTGTANKEGITELGGGWAFRNTATNTALYQEAMPAWTEEFDITTAALIFDEAEPVSAAAAMTAIPQVAATQGVDIVNGDAPITFTRGQTDFATVVQRIADVEADGLIVMSGPEEAGLIAREMARQGERRSVLGHPAQGTPAFYERGGDAISDWVLPLIMNSVEPADKARAYVAAMAERDEDPPTVAEAANYYDSVLLLAQVMKDAGINGDTGVEEARVAIRTGLLGISDYQGVTGEISFDGSADATKTVWVHVVRQGGTELLGAE